MTPEGRVKAAVKRVLERYEKIYRFMPVQSGYGAKTLDFLICVRGVFVAIETKAPGKTLTALQSKCVDEITAAGGRVFVIDGDTTELELFLEGATTRKPKSTK